MATAVRRGRGGLTALAAAAMGLACSSPYVPEGGAAGAGGTTGGGYDAPPPFQRPDAQGAGPEAPVAHPDAPVGPDLATDLGADEPPADAPADSSAPDAGVDMAADARVLDTAPADAAGDGPAIDATADSTPADGPADARADAGSSDGPSGTDEARYRKYLADVTMALSKRNTDCFHSAPIDLTVPGPTSGLWVSLRNGFSTVNDAAAAACVAGVATVSCDDLAADKLGAACNEVLVGHVALGHYCRIDEDCGTTANYCKFDFAVTCGSTCAARPKLGERCTDVCTPDTFCQPQADGTRCAALLGEGQACEGGQCAPGLFCQSTGDPLGKCRRIATGLACTGTWQCPGAYACVIPGGASAGTCQVGGGLGAVCHVLTGGGVIDSDCGPGLRCLPDGTGKNTCTLGHALHESCAVAADAQMAGELCREGFCSVATPNVCTAFGQRNGACSDDAPCDVGLTCPAGICLPEEIPANEACGASDQRKCVPGTFCKTSVPDGPGVCAPLRAENEACQREECAPPADCVNNVCRRCL